jgi:HEAT repeat protein
MSTIFDVIIGSILLLTGIFLFLIFRRQFDDIRTAKRQAASLWQTREILGCLVSEQGGSDAALKAAVRGASLNVILHILHLQRGELRDRLLAVAEASGKFDPLLADLARQNPRRKLRALHQLQACSTKRCIEAVRRQVFRTRNGALRLEAISALLEMGYRPQKAELIAMLRGTGNKITPRHSAILRKIGETYAGNLPELFAGADTPQLQGMVILLLGFIPNRLSVWALQELAQDDSPSIRIQALHALERLSQAEARRCAADLTGDPVMRVREAAQRMLRRCNQELAGLSSLVERRQIA